MNDVTIVENATLAEQFEDVLDQTKAIVTSETCEAMRIVCNTTCTNYND